MLKGFVRPGKASFVIGGQWGSESKGNANAFLATRVEDKFDIVTTNNGANSGHTSVHNGTKKVVFHLPTYSLYQPCFTYLNAGSIIDLEVLNRELIENMNVLNNGFAIHPNAAIITPECREAEMQEDSPQTKIASTRKGVGQALARKVLRSGMRAIDCEELRNFIKRMDLNNEMLTGRSVLVEVPQGHSLSIDSQFYPHVTSRNCTIGQALADAGIHPHFYQSSMLVVRTFPIRVGSLSAENHSGDCFTDQKELTWEQLGVEAEITTVTKRIRRVFTFSEQQVAQAIAAIRPNVIFISFCDYVPKRYMVKDIIIPRLRELNNQYGQRNRRVDILTAWGPNTTDIVNGDDL